MTAGRGATIARTSYNLPSAITNGSISTQFFYAPDRSYWKQVAVYTGGTETTLYLGGLLEKVTRANGTTDWRHRIATPGAGSILYIRQSGGTNLTYSIAGDHLGSTSVVTDAAQALVVSESYGAFGARRGSNWQGTPSSGDLTQIEATTRRGFTDHTMVDNLNLIHMNGRMYDPVIGRFLSADPYPLIGRVALPDPSGRNTDVTQVFNRYSYVNNNPLSYTDPSGFIREWDEPGTGITAWWGGASPGFAMQGWTPLDGIVIGIAHDYHGDLEACGLDGACQSAVFRSHFQDYAPASLVASIMAQVSAQVSAGVQIKSGARIGRLLTRLDSLGLLGELKDRMNELRVMNVELHEGPLPKKIGGRTSRYSGTAIIIMSEQLMKRGDDEAVLAVAHELFHAGQRPVGVPSVLSLI
ncbi:MAG: RHS repeat-associated core domain-containing protein [Gemmatimonadaceae bacterium]|nr:RHS repeat-associated core domain-containing protein [Gemmatimonadaceae bacterium]